MDSTTPLQLQAYGGLPSAAKQSNPYMFNFDQGGIKNIPTVGANTAGKPSLPPLSAIGNEKFEWGNEMNGGALGSPNIFQHKGSAFPYTPIITGAPFSSLAKGQNFFNFTNTSMNDDQTAMNQMTNSTNANNNAYAATPQGISQFYGDNLNSLYGNSTFNGNNLQAAVAANGMISSQQPNYQITNGGINTLGGPKISEDASTPFKMDNTFQFNFNTQAINNQANTKNPSSIIQVNNNNNKPVQNGLVNQNQQNDYLGHNQMKFGQNGINQPSQFMPQQQQFNQQQNQQGQQNQQIQQQQAPQQQQFQTFQKNQFLNGALNNFGNNTAEQQLIGDSSINMNQLANNTGNGVANPQQQLATVSAAGNQSSEKKKPQIQLSLQIPQGNSVNGTNNQNPQNNTNNPTNINQNANGPLNTTDGSGFNYFSQYQNNIGLAPFTPIGPTTIGFQQLNGAPPSSHRPPFTAQRTGLYPESFFFNAQSIPEQYPLLTPGNNTGYNKQSFFYPTSDQTAVAQSQFSQMQYDSTKYQHPSQAQTHPNNAQHFQQHPIPFHQQQQQQQQQQNPYQQHQGQNTLQQQNPQLMPQQTNIGIDQQQLPENNDKNDQKNKNLNLKLDVSTTKDNNIFGEMQNFQREQQNEQKNGMLNFGNNAHDQTNKVGANGQDDDKDKNIISMLQKSNPQNNLTPNSYFDAANMSLIIDFYQKANPEKKQQLYDFLSNQQSDDKDDKQSKSQKIIEHIITSNTKRIGTLTLSQRQEKIKRYREKRQRRANTSLVKYKKQQIAVSKKPRDKNGKFLKQVDEEGVSKKKIKKK